ncbi:MAG: hypothetical protein PVG60_03525, partial [Desulfarculaceae bacterium]
WLFKEKALSVIMLGLILFQGLFFPWLPSAWAGEQQICLSCHLSQPGRHWFTLAELAVRPEGYCPGLKELRREMLLTESRLTRVSQYLAYSQDMAALPELRQRLRRWRARFQALLSRSLLPGMQNLQALREVRKGIENDLITPLAEDTIKRRRHGLWFALSLAVLLLLGVAVIGWWRGFWPYGPHRDPWRLVKEGRLYFHSGRRVR